MNVFYLVNLILQSFPSISTNAPVYGGVVLLLLVMIGMVKELLADLKRYKMDKQSNG